MPAFYFQPHLQRHKINAIYFVTQVVSASQLSVYLKLRWRFAMTNVSTFQPVNLYFPIWAGARPAPATVFIYTFITLPHFHIAYIISTLPAVNSPSHLLTTLVASALPNTFVPVRNISQK
jgi:hypothetical protein